MQLKLSFLMCFEKLWWGDLLKVVGVLKTLLLTWWPYQGYDKYIFCQKSIELNSSPVYTPPPPPLSPW